MAIVITVHNHKGGTGKSFITVNLAGTLASMKFRVLHVDMDGQGNSSSRLGFHRHEDNILQIYEKGMPLPIKVSEFSDKLHIVPGSRSSTKFGYDVFKYMNDFKDVLKDRLEEVSDAYDFVIIDTPPDGVSPMTNYAFHACDYLLIPIDSDGPNSAENFDTVMEQYYDVSLQQPKIKLLGIVQNTYKKDLSSRLVEDASRVFIEDREEGSFKKLMFKTKIREYKKFQQASWGDKPIAFFEPNSDAAANFLEFTKEVLSRVGVKAGKR